jgi:UDP-N-acetylmuramate dehydrogenase
MREDIALLPLFRSLQGKALQKESLAAYTSWRVGGPADCIYIPANVDDLAKFLKEMPADVPIEWLGLGSNTLIRDGGVEGVVVVTQGALNSISQLDPLTVRVEAGVASGQIARHTARLGLMGLEFLAGIPGTVGGALAMNAGCYGAETWEHVALVETIDRNGIIKTRTPKEYEIAYRHVKGPSDEWFIAAHFHLVQGEKNQALDNIRNLLEKRNLAQPTSWPNGGSVFRNPPGDFAGRLIERCGLKGTTMGDARVSEKHANFIIHEGAATAADIEALILHVADVVEKEQGVRLHREVCIIGKTP